MYFDPPERFRLTDKPPELSPSEIAAEESRFVEDVRRELTIRGDSSKTIAALVGEMRSRLVVTPRLGPKHDTRYQSRAGGLLNARQAAEDIVEAADERDSLLAHGPDPEELLRKRLVEVGIPEGEARLRAAGRVTRLEDGRVIARDSTLRVIYTGPQPERDREYTELQKSVFTDAGPALQRVTRAIVEERARGGASDPLNKPVQSYDAVEAKRDFVRGAL